MRTALRTLLFSVGYEARTYPSAVDFLERFSADTSSGCILLDIRLPGISGIDLQAHLKHIGAAMPVIFITGHADVAMAVRAMKDGAFEFIEKPFREQDLLDRINRAMVRDLEARKDDAHLAELRRRRESLTPRERQVMQLIAAGAVNRDVARDLGVSERTVEIHRSRVMQKMEVRSVARLVKLQVSLDAPGSG
jgi:FixJ family two-component response regulator